jgi:hypothetical protein
VIGFIDPPGPFSPKKQWEEFLRDMQALPQSDPQVKAAVAKAHEALQARRWRTDQQQG